jgi:hypothetical protein
MFIFKSGKFRPYVIISARLRIESAKDDILRLSLDTPQDVVFHFYPEGQKRTTDGNWRA